MPQGTSRPVRGCRRWSGGAPDLFRRVEAMALGVIVVALASMIVAHLAALRGPRRAPLHRSTGVHHAPARDVVHAADPLAPRGPRASFAPNDRVTGTLSGAFTSAWSRPWHAHVEVSERVSRIDGHASS